MTRKAATIPNPTIPAKAQAKQNNPPKQNGSSPAAKKREVTHQMIAERAYEIYLSGTGGTPEENWYRAERELRGQ